MATTAVSPRSSLGDTLVAIALLLTALCAFVPFEPVLPDIGLDPSWRHAINEAVARGFPFGSRIVFTYGPYASVFTGAWHPAVAGLTFGASAWLAFTYAVALRTIVPRGAVAVPLLACVAIAFVSTSRDVLLLSSPLLATFATTVFATRTIDRRQRVRLHLLAAIVYSAAGLLILVKGNLIVACGASTLLNAAFLGRARRGSIAFVALAAPLVTALAFWTLAGQPWHALLPYLSTSWSIARGYSTAMALFGDSQTVVEYLVGVALLVGVVLSRRRDKRSMRAFVAASLLLFLFVAFKASFVRQDGEHALIASTFLLLASGGLWIARRSIGVAVATVACTGLWITAELRHDPLFPLTVAMKVTAPYENAVEATRHRWADDRWPRSAYDEALARIVAARPLPTLDGTTDIYSHAQSLLLASGADWSPRPVFQSYAAYDAALAARNAAFLAGPDAPRNILFAIEPIDRRLPALEDGASWPALLDRYESLGFANGLLRLRRRHVADAADAADLRIFATTQQTIGDVVIVPDGVERLSIALDIQPTFQGRLTALLYKASALLIAIELVDGSSHTFLLPPTMAHSPFQLSPLVTNTLDFAALYRPGIDTSAKRVRAFRILPNRDGDDGWEPHYTVSFFRQATSP